MRVVGLDHVNITGTAALLERCRAFYVDVLGLTDGPRPPFRSRGFWLYAGEHPVVHLTERAADAERASTSLDHFAFRCEDFDAAVRRLTELGIAFTVDPARDTKAAQLFVEDPAGVAVELNFVG
jgi:catechol 2,3-dioxygenase-like lactoylglutathione lyase family enzyme